MNQSRKPGRPSKSARNTSDDIFHAGLQRFSAQGYDETSLRQIAEDARVDASLIVYQYGSKLELWQAIITRQSQDLREQLDRAEGTMSAESPATALRHAMESFVDFLVSRPTVPQLLLRDLSANDERTDWLLKSMTMPLQNHFALLAGAAVEAGDFAQDHCAFRIANFIYAAANCVARRERLSKLVNGLDDDAAFRGSLTAVLVDPLFCHG